MPIYEYQCQECGEEFEKLVRSFSSAPEVECPHCGGKKVKKAFSLFRKVCELWWPVCQHLRSNWLKRLREVVYLHGI